MQKDFMVCNLRSLTKSETSEYIKHRLKIAGTEKKLFSSGAIDKIFQYSCGIPRMINTICDHALMIGYSADLIKIRTSVGHPDLILKNFANKTQSSLL